MSGYDQPRSLRKVSDEERDQRRAEMKHLNDKLDELEGIEREERRSAASEAEKFDLPNAMRPELPNNRHGRRAAAAMRRLGMFKRHR